ncbi:MAG: 2-oxoacid:acceptor oxidoreductase subunit alpha, partial [Proteobacteria bacterium]|nr:2-oxoacid:acceptor oxidoreductase subunit alpha [Pseudomonadota bacterium]
LKNDIDLLVALDPAVIGHVDGRLREDTVILADFDASHLERKVLSVPITAIAKDAGGELYGNTVAVGVLTALLDGDPDILEEHVRGYFSRKKPEVIEHNVDAVRKGYRAGEKLREEEGIRFSVGRDEDVAERLLVNGAEAIGMGAIAGGCNFIASYPMSPSTAVLTFLASRDEEFGIVAEQAEDEIAAVNMTLGAWYAGARAMATTSGGGFALMEEGISLAGVLEAPLVIHLAQRPGPGTGLPTRTEQGDLELALYAGHGEFPRVIYAPGTIEEAFLLAAKAFNVADRCQLPVFILTDQYTMDTYYDLSGLPLEETEAISHIVKTRVDYLRYRITGDGISPRGIPGFGDGLVAVDSDEHDEEGHITESAAVRTAMVEKRLRKMDQVIKDAVPPVLSGPEDFRTLLVGWGSTFHVIEEAMAMTAGEKTAHLHFPQVYPLPPQARSYLDRAEKVVVIENNATGQFGRLLKIHADRKPDRSILKYDGSPFTVEGLASALDGLE